MHQFDLSKLKTLEPLLNTQYTELPWQQLRGTWSRATARAANSLKYKVNKLVRIKVLWPTWLAQPKESSNIIKWGWCLLMQRSAPQNSYAGCLEYRGFCLLYLVTLLLLISFVVVVAALDMLLTVVYILNDYYYCYYCCYHYIESSYNSIAPANTDMVKCLLSETFLEKVAHLNHG